MSPSVVFLVLCALACIKFGQSCPIEGNHTEMSIKDLFQNSDIIVFGMDKEHTERKVQNMTVNEGMVEDCMFKVYCIFKGESISENIVIERIWPRSSCSGSSGKLHVGDKMVVALRMTESGNYEYNEETENQPAVFPLNVRFATILANVTDEMMWTPPLEALDRDEDMCPDLMELEEAEAAAAAAANATTEAEPETTTTYTMTTIQGDNSTAAIPTQSFMLSSCLVFLLYVI